jgi:GNAT superfamily N-acetyltransferase
MKLRLANKDDIPAMVELGRGVHAESRFAALPYDAVKLARALEGLLDRQARGTHCFLLVENREGRVIGGFIGGLESYFFTSARSANSILIWVAPEYRGSAAALRMISAFREWAKKNGATEACILVASGVAIGRTDRFLQRLGFKQTGGNYAVSLV